jgi:hypothetical protein
MLLEEWQQIAAVIDNAWRGGFDDHRSASYFALLRGYETVQVERALHVLVANGNPFVPAVAEIVQAIEAQEHVGVPTWPEALAVVRRVLPRFSRDHAAGLAKLAETHQIVASWVATYGWDRLSQEPIDDPDYGGAVLRRLEDSYREHVQRQQERQRHGLAIETVERQRIAGPRKPDFAGALGAGGAS